MINQKSTQRSPMSINELVHSNDADKDSNINTTDSLACLNDIDDPDVKLAAEVLGDMARLSSATTQKDNRAPQIMTLPSLSTPSTTPSSPLPTPTNSSILQQQQHRQQRLSFSSESTLDDETYYQHYQQSLQQPLQRNNNSLFIHRVSNIPIVNSALKAYEHSKSKNSVMKYGAEMVESFAAPIYDKFGKHALSNVDEWGCKQLDKLEQRYPKYVSPRNKRYKEEKDQNNAKCMKTLTKTNAEIKVKEDDNTILTEDDADDAKSATFALSRASLVDEYTFAADSANAKTSSLLRKRKDTRNHHHYHHSQSVSPHSMRNNYFTITKPIPSTTATARHHHLNSIAKSKWHQIVLNASSAAGTTAAVISEESMKCLKYCLHWLQYASQHIDQQMNLLQQFLNNKKLQMEQQQNPKSVEADDSSVLTNIKKEVIDTLRKVVDVISKYAGAGLPEQAKTTVRGFILALPSRWAKLNHLQQLSAPSSSSIPTNRAAVNNNLHETSIKLLNFGTEAIDMIHSVTQVFSDTIDRADLWIHRLKVVGVTAPSARIRKQQHQQKSASHSSTAKYARTNSEPERMDFS